MTQTTSNDSAVLATIREVAEQAGADKVFGAPVTHNGLTVLPVAKVSGGGGGGSGTGPVADGSEADGAGTGSGSGTGLGLRAKPLGVFVIKDGDVTWRPAVDVNRAILGGQLVAVTALLVVRALVKARARRTGAAGHPRKFRLPRRRGHHAS